MIYFRKNICHYVEIKLGNFIRECYRFRYFKKKDGLRMFCQRIERNKSIDDCGRVACLHSGIQGVAFYEVDDSIPGRGLFYIISLSDFHNKSAWITYFGTRAT